MNIDYLIAYYYVVSLGSYSKAAKKLHISQPGISLQIQNLEREFRLPLLEYKNKKIRMTEAGKRLFRFAEHIYYEQFSLNRDFERLRKALSGTLSIIASRITAEFVLPPIIADFKGSFSSIGTSITVSDSTNVIKQLVDGTYEIGFCSIMPDKHMLESIWIGKESIVLIVPPDHHLARFEEVALAEVSGESFVLRVDTWEKQHEPADLLLNAGLDVSQCKSKLVIGTNRGVLTAVESGAGIAFMPDMVVRESAAAGKVKVLKIKDINLGRDFYCAFKKEGSFSPVVCEFINFVKTKAAGNFYSEGT